MKKMRLTFIILFCFCTFHSVSAQESKFKALFIYKFAEYIEWPAGAKNTTIGVVGKSDVFDQLTVFAANKANIQVISIEEVSETEKCQIIFVPKNRNKMMQEFANKIGGKSILLVSDDSDMVQSYSDIGFYLEDGKLRFLISPKSIEVKKMAPSSKLLSLGKNI